VGSERRARWGIGVNISRNTQGGQHRHKKKKKEMIGAPRGGASTPTRVWELLRMKEGTEPGKKKGAVLMISQTE